MALEADLQTLDSEYNTLSHHMAKGEQADFSPELLVGTLFPKACPTLRQKISI